MTLCAYTHILEHKNLNTEVWGLRESGGINRMKAVEGYFKGLADVNRLRIINLLLQGELCGCDIQYVIGSSQSNVSRHLAYLKRAGLVADRREGYRVYYHLAADTHRPEFKALISYLRVALKDSAFILDIKRLKRAMKNGSCSISERATAASRPSTTRMAARG